MRLYGLCDHGRAYTLNFWARVWKAARNEGPWEYGFVIMLDVILYVIWTARNLPLSQ
jgi:hypothetical protein